MYMYVVKLKNYLFCDDTTPHYMYVIELGNGWFVFIIVSPVCELYLHAHMLCMEFIEFSVSKFWAAPKWWQKWEEWTYYTCIYIDFSYPKKLFQWKIVLCDCDVLAVYSQNSKIGEKLLDMFASCFIFWQQYDSYNGVS